MAKKKPVASKTEPDLSYISEPLRPLAVPVDDIDLDPANARKHGTENLSALRGSLRSFGQCKPIVVNKRTRIVEAGNGTLTCARAMGWSHIAVVFVEHDPSQAAAFAISDNRVSDLSTWDTDALDKILREIETGDEDLQAMLSKLAEDEKLPCFEEAKEIVEDEVPEPPAVPITKPGDLWLLGAYYECEACGKKYEYEEGRKMKEVCPCG